MTAKDLNSIIDLMASRYQPIATPEVVETLTMRCVDLVKRHGLTREHLREIFRALIHPATLARVEFASQLLAEFGKQSFRMVSVAEMHARGRRDLAARLNPADPPKMLHPGAFSTLIGDILASAKDQEAEGRPQDETGGGPQGQARTGPEATPGESESQGEGPGDCPF